VTFYRVKAGKLIVKCASEAHVVPHHRAGRGRDRGRRKTTLMESVGKKVSQKRKSTSKFGLIRDDS